MSAKLYEIADNYINGNLTDFKRQFAALNAPLRFMAFVELYYGEKTAKEMRDFLERRGLIEEEQ